VDNQATKHDAQPWLAEEENHLYRLVNEPEYRQEQLGEQPSSAINYVNIARFLSRTVNGVKQKYAELYQRYYSPDYEQLALAAAAEAAGMDPAQYAQQYGYINVDPNQMAAYTAEQLAAIYHHYHYDQSGVPGLGGSDGGTLHEQGGGAGMLAGGPVGDGMMFGQNGFPSSSAPHIDAYNAAAAAAAVNAAAFNSNNSNVAMRDMITPPSTRGTGKRSNRSSASRSLGPTPKNDRVFWKVYEQEELLKLVEDERYRRDTLGTESVDWELIAKQLGRGRRSVMRKYDNLKGCSIAPGGGSVILPANDGKKWSEEEVDELRRLCDDPMYRQSLFGPEHREKIDWRRMGIHFERSYESVSYKYSYIKNTDQRMGDKPKHSKAKHETSYKDMAIWALAAIGGEGTSGKICDKIESKEEFSRQLDRAIVSGKKTLQRWKHGVRSALNAFGMFHKTERISDGEVVWIMDMEALNKSIAQQEQRVIAKSKKDSNSKRKHRKRDGASLTDVDQLETAELDKNATENALAEMACTEVGREGTTNQQQQQQQQQQQTNGEVAGPSSSAQKSKPGGANKRKRGGGRVANKQSPLAATNNTTANATAPLPPPFHGVQEQDLLGAAVMMASNGSSDPITLLLQQQLHQAAYSGFPVYNVGQQQQQQQQQQEQQQQQQQEEQWGAM
jgi:hypothetical protein